MRPPVDLASNTILTLNIFERRGKIETVMMNCFFHNHSYVGLVTVTFAPVSYYRKLKILSTIRRA